MVAHTKTVHEIQTQSLQFSIGDKNLVTQLLTCLNDMHKIIQAKVILFLKYSNFLNNYLRRYLYKSGFLGGSL